MSDKFIRTLIADFQGELDDRPWKYVLIEFPAGSDWIRCWLSVRETRELARTLAGLADTAMKANSGGTG